MSTQRVDKAKAATGGMGGWRGLHPGPTSSVSVRHARSLWRRMHKKALRRARRRHSRELVRET